MSAESILRLESPASLESLLGNVSETPTPTTCLKSTAAHLQFVWQYAPHLYRCAFLASKLRRKGNPAVRLPFVLQYASHLYAVRPPFVRRYFWKNTGGRGRRNVSEIINPGRFQSVSGDSLHRDDQDQIKKIGAAKKTFESCLDTF